MTAPALLPPQACGNAWCRREGRCFYAWQGQPRCTVRPPAPPREAVLQSIGHRPNPMGRPGFAEKRGPVEHMTYVGPDIYEAIRTKAQPFLIVQADADYRRGDMLLVRESGSTRHCLRVISAVQARHGGLVSGYAVLGLAAN